VRRGLWRLGRAAALPRCPCATLDVLLVPGPEGRKARAQRGGVPSTSCARVRPHSARVRAMPGKSWDEKRRGLPRRVAGGHLGVQAWLVFRQEVASAACLAPAVGHDRREAHDARALALAHGGCLLSLSKSSHSSSTTRAERNSSEFENRVGKSLCAFKFTNKLARLGVLCSQLFQTKHLSTHQPRHWLPRRLLLPPPPLSGLGRCPRSSARRRMTTVPMSSWRMGSRAKSVGTHNCSHMNLHIRMPSHASPSTHTHSHTKGGWVGGSEKGRGVPCGFAMDTSPMVCRPV